MKTKNKIRILAALLAVLTLASCMRAAPKNTETENPAAPAETQAPAAETEEPALTANPDPGAPETEVPDDKPVSHKLSIVSPASYHEVYELRIEQPLGRPEICRDSGRDGRGIGYGSPRGSADAGCGYGGQFLCRG